jgi:hypothetical protein
MVEEREIEGRKYLNVYTDIVKPEDNTLAFFRLYENGSEGEKVDRNSVEDYEKIRDLVYRDVDQKE